MAGPTNTERIHQLEGKLPDIAARQLAQAKQLDDLEDELKTAQASNADHEKRLIVAEKDISANASLKETVGGLDKRQLATEKELEAIKHRLAELEKRNEAWTNRLWMILPPLVAVLATFLLTYAFLRK